MAGSSGAAVPRCHARPHQPSQRADEFSANRSAGRHVAPGSYLEEQGSMALCNEVGIQCPEANSFRLRSVISAFRLTQLIIHPKPVRFQIRF
jgi:hypothetical protein